MVIHAAQGLAAVVGLSFCLCPPARMELVTSENNYNKNINDFKGHDYHITFMIVTT